VAAKIKQQQRRQAACRQCKPCMAVSENKCHISLHFIILIGLEVTPKFVIAEQLLGETAAGVQFPEQPQHYLYTMLYVLKLSGAELKRTI